MEKQFFLETVDLKTAEEAQLLLDRENAGKKRLTAALVLSAFASVMMIVGLFGLPTLLGLGFILIIPAYILGGFGSALANVLKMIAAGWRCLIFLFPINILPAAFMAILGVFLLLYVPVFFIAINYKQHQKNIKAAQSMLEKPANESPAAE